MIGLIASAVECSYLTVATFSALFSILQPKIKSSLILISIPILAALAPTTLAANKIVSEDGENEGIDMAKSILN
uniref:Uncharacterized protein n=1 Tax=Meloidogyne enterolobii TaxID=390850 RepID=A0A6V7URK1_MELEN|nr:unnamed protein product [Meloidogyne enterolobii]